MYQSSQLGVKFDRTGRNSCELLFKKINHVKNILSKFRHFNRNTRSNH